MALVIANWKMHMDVPQSSLFLERIAPKVTDSPHEVVICPSFTALYSMAEAIRSRGWADKIKLGAQNINDHDEGAYTGEVSAEQIKNLVDYVIIGHSERRTNYNETDALIAKKLNSALRHDITPILCVGENAAQRQAGQSAMVVTDQLNEDLHDITASDAESLVIAYEPIWAIGTGEFAKPDQASEMMGAIKKVLQNRYGEQAAGKIPILYGGSVDETNAKAYLSLQGCGGLLVGGASIIEDKFSAIAHA